PVMFVTMSYEPIPEGNDETSRLHHDLRGCARDTGAGLACQYCAGPASRAAGATRHAEWPSWHHTRTRGDAGDAGRHGPDDVSLTRKCQHACHAHASRKDPPHHRRHPRLPPPRVHHCGADWPDALSGTPESRGTAPRGSIDPAWGPLLPAALAGR